MTAFNRVRARAGSIWAAIRERFAPLPVDDEARIEGWIPAPNVAEKVAQDSVSGTADDDESRIANHAPAFVRTVDLTELVDLGDVDPATPIYDALVADLAQLDAAKRRAMRTPTAEFWAIVDASRGYFCTHCADDGDHTLCPGCECGCLLVGAAS